MPLYSRQAAGEPLSEPSRPEFAYAARSCNRTLITTEGAMLPELLSRTALQGQLPEGEGLVSLPWPSDGSADSVDSLIDLATAALARDGACIISDAMPREACEALLAETAPYIDACHRAEGTGNSRPGSAEFHFSGLGAE